MNPNSAQSIQTVKKAAANADTSLSSEILEKIDEYTHPFFYVVQDGKTLRPRFELQTLLTVCALLIVALGSACWAASIASARRHNPIPHFILGLCLPVIYPLIILFALDIPGKWTVQDEDKKKEEKQVAELEKQEENKLRPDENGEIPYEPSQEYFTAIARNNDGTPAGPWNVLFEQTPIVVTQIIEPLPECVSVEFYDKSPEQVRKMRLPYAKIRDWQKKA